MSLATSYGTYVRVCAGSSERSVLLSVSVCLHLCVYATQSLYRWQIKTPSQRQQISFSLDKLYHIPISAGLRASLGTIWFRVRHSTLSKVGTQIKIDSCHVLTCQLAGGQREKDMLCSVVAPLKRVSTVMDNFSFNFQLHCPHKAIGLAARHKQTGKRHNTAFKMLWRDIIYKWIRKMRQMTLQCCYV